MSCWYQDIRAAFADREWGGGGAGTEMRCKFKLLKNWAALAVWTVSSLPLMWFTDYLPSTGSSTGHQSSEPAPASWSIRSRKPDRWGPAITNVVSTAKGRYPCIGQSMRGTSLIIHFF